MKIYEVSNCANAKLKKNSESRRSWRS